MIFQPFWYRKSNPVQEIKNCTGHAQKTARGTSLRAVFIVSTLGFFLLVSECFQPIPSSTGADGVIVSSGQRP